MAVNPIPRGYAGATPYLIIRDADRALAFYKKVFDAREKLHLKYPDGKVAHAELAIGEGHVMLSEEMPESGYRGPLSFGGTPVSLLVYVEDVDAVFAKAIAAGAETKHPVADQFYGDRSGSITDPFGHVWYVTTHIEDLSPDEITRRAAAISTPAKSTPAKSKGQNP
jgi:PhnB protein